MKRLTLVAAIVGFMALVAASYAEVQSVRLSGELRLRGYWTDHMTALGHPGYYGDSDTFIAQRTRVSVEWDLTDHVLVVATMQAQGVWGTSAAGNGFYANGVKGNYNAQHADTVEMVEAYVRFSELFWTPLNLQIGRQGLNFGNGLIFSNNDKAYRFDAARVTWDELAAKGYAVDFVIGKLAQMTGGSTLSNYSNADLPGPGTLNTNRDGDIFFANLRWEPQNIKHLKDLEFYVGYMSNPIVADEESATGNPTLEQSRSYVWLFGVRGDVEVLKNWKVWGEFAFETGESNANYPSNYALDTDLNGWLLDVGTSYTFENMKWKPVIWAGFTLATGSNETNGNVSNRTFRPWFDYQNRGGIALSPVLSNIQILALGVKATPSDKCDVWATAYRYFQDKVSDDVAGNPYADIGGVQAIPNATHKDLGWEVDLGAGYNYSKDVKASLIFGMFVPGTAYDTFSGGIKTWTAKDAYLLRGEIEVKF